MASLPFDLLPIALSAVSATGTGASLLLFRRKVRPRDDYSWRTDAVGLLAMTLSGLFAALFLTPPSPQIGLMFGVAAATAVFTFLYGPVPRHPFAAADERIEEIQRNLSKAEAAVENEPEKTRPVWDLSRNQLELYVNRNLAQVGNIFWITIVVMTAGFGMVVYGVYRAFDTQLQVAILTTAAGVITQTIGATFLLIYRSTMSQATDYVATIERINAVGMAVAIVDLIPDEDREIKSKARADLVKQILPSPTRAVGTTASRRARNK